MPQDLTEKNPTTNEKNTKGSVQSEVKKAENESTHKTIKEKHGKFFTYDKYAILLMMTAESELTIRLVMPGTTVL